MVVVHIDPSPVVAALQEAKGRFHETAAQGFAEAGRKVVDLFRQEWLSGRGAGDLGLNIVTGRLNQSVKSLTTVRTNSITSEVFNRGADYWWYHENPQGGRHQFLYLEEAFQEDGIPLYEDAIAKAMEAIA